MKPLFDVSSTIDEFKLLPFECEMCTTTFYVTKNKFKYTMKFSEERKLLYFKYCGIQCRTKSQTRKTEIPCGQCGKVRLITRRAIKKSKSGLGFCSQSCSAIYSNTHKTKGTRRSKLEVWLQKQLITFYPELNILYGNKETINSELDIYIPSLKIAFELNGIFHYEPIYGSDKLSAIKNNDNRKFQACLEHGIELVIIDSSMQKNFSPKSSQKYFDIINNIIEMKI